MLGSPGIPICDGLRGRKGGRECEFVGKAPDPVRFACSGQARDVLNENEWKILTLDTLHANIGRILM